MKRLFWVGLLVASVGFGVEEAAFLKIPSSAREAALAKAVTSISFDLTGLHTNPAALGQIGNMGLTSTYSSWLADMGYTSIAFAFRPKESLNSFAISMIGLSVSDIEKRSRDGELEGTFGAQNYAFGLSYARVSDTLLTLSYGITLKYLRDAIDEDVAHGYCMDAGLTYRIPREVRVHSQAIPNYLGFAVTSLGPGFQEKASEIGTRQSFHPPMRASLGLAYDLPVTPMINSIISLDAILSLTGGHSGVALGVETDINRIFFIRFGFKQSSMRKIHYGIGCGFKIGDFSVDYVYSFKYIEGTQAFSASLDF